MAINRHLEDTAFGLEDIKVISVAFGAALNALRIANVESPMAKLIAKNIVDVTLRSERNPILLQERALGPAKAFGTT